MVRRRIDPDNAPPPTPKATGGKRHRQKGDRNERRFIAKLMRDTGVSAVRVPLSGAMGGLYAGDVSIENNAMIAEVKARSTGSGWVTLEKWLGMDRPEGPFDLLVLMKDRADPLVAMPWSTFCTLIGCARELSLFHGAGLFAEAPRNARLRGANNRNSSRAGKRPR